MTASRVWVVVGIGACAGAGCHRSSEQAGAPTKAASLAERAPPSTELRVAPSGETDDDVGPHLPFKITRVYTDEAPSPQAPWHGGHGSWTFFDAETPGGGGFTAGYLLRPARGDDPIRFGKAMLVAPDHARAQQLTRELAAVFQVVAPPDPGGQAAGAPLQLSLAVLGEHQDCHPGGGCTDNGPWTASKWFFGDGSVEAYLNFDLDGKQGDFIEKDASYRNDLVAAFASLRDGPTAK